MKKISSENLYFLLESSNLVADFTEHRLRCDSCGIILDETLIGYILNKPEGAKAYCNRAYCRKEVQKISQKSNN